MISALSSGVDQIKGFELQIDDYIPKTNFIFHDD